MAEIPKVLAYGDVTQAMRGVLDAQQLLRTSLEVAKARPQATMLPKTTKLSAKLMPLALIPSKSLKIKALAKPTKMLPQKRRRRCYL